MQHLYQNSTKAHKLEEAIYQQAGFNIFENLHIFDVPINFRGQTEYIHTTRCGDENEDILIFIHGYGGNGIAFLSLLKDLQKRFKIYCVDLLGLGLSSRPKLEKESAQEAIDSFLEGIEGWRQALNIENFILCGHSLGAYLSALYAHSNPKRVNKLYLFSPPGLHEDNDTRSPVEQLDDLNFFRRQFMKILMKIYHNEVVVSEFKENYPKLFKWWLYGYVRFRLKIKGNEGNLIEEFMNELSSMTLGAEKCIYKMFYLPKANAYNPLEKKIVNDMKMDIHIVFCSTDYLYFSAAQKIQQLQFKQNQRCTVLEGIGHQVTIEDAPSLVKIILDENTRQNDVNQ